MASPTLKGVGAANGGIASVTYSYPFPFDGGEFLLLVVEDANEGTLPTLTGWTIVSGTPSGTGTAAGTAATAIRAYYKFAAPGDTLSATLGDLGDHQDGFIMAFEGVDATTPLDVSAVTSVAASASTSVAFPSITTTTNGALVVCLVANATDTTTRQGSSFAHAGLTGVASGGANSLQGNGGGIDYLYGVRSTAGATGTGSCTLATSSVQACLTLALRPNQASAAQVTKLNSYAVSGAPPDAAAVVKMTAYAITASADSFASLSKLAAYAVVVPVSSSARPSVFVAT